jgi:hypothetical protein
MATLPEITHLNLNLFTKGYYFLRILLNEAADQSRSRPVSLVLG